MKSSATVARELVTDDRPGMNERESMTIWERMLLEERKHKASARGVKVSDLEEEELMAQSIQESVKACEKMSETNKNSAMEGVKKSTATTISSTLIATLRVENAKLKDEEDEEAILFAETEAAARNTNISTTTASAVYIRDLTEVRHQRELRERTTGEIVDGAEEKKKEGEEKEDLNGPWIKLPQDLVDRIVMFCGDVDMCGYLRIASRTTFQPSEATYRFLSQITYPEQQQAARTLRKKSNFLVEANVLKNWRSWYNMIVHRPRLRTNGFYTLRTLYTRAPCNDAFWEEKQYRSVEVEYYRHMRFFDCGRVLYSLDIVAPREMTKLFAAGLPIDKRVFEGSYTMNKREIVVVVPMHYCVMHFSLYLMDGDDGYMGKHNMLRMLEHYSTTLPAPPRNFSSSPSSSSGLHEQPVVAMMTPLQLQQVIQQRAIEQHRVCFPLPTKPDMRFHRVWRFTARQGVTYDDGDSTDDAVGGSSDD